MNGCLAKSAFSSGYWETFTEKSIEIYEYYRPLTLLSFKIEKILWGVNPLIMRLGNIILFLLGSLLLYLWLKKQNGLADFAEIIILIFIFFPLQLDNLTWIVARADQLFFLFTAITLLLFELYLRQKKHLALLVAGISFLCALLSKEGALFLPLPILAHFYFQKKRKELLSLIVILTAPIIIYWWLKTLVIGHLPFPFEFKGLIAFLETVTGSSGYFFRLLFFPFFYLIFLPIEAIYNNFYYFLGTTIFLGSILLIIKRNQTKEIILGLSWIYLPLLPYILMSALFAKQPFIYGRYVQFSIIGLAIIGGYLLNKLSQRLQKLILTGIILIFGITIIFQHQLYSSEIKFFKTIWEKNPQNIILTYQYATSLLNAEQFITGERFLKTIIQQNKASPGYEQFCLLMAALKKKQADYEQAIFWINRIETTKLDFHLLLNAKKFLYEIYKFQGNYRQAQEYLQGYLHLLTPKQRGAVLLDFWIAFEDWNSALNWIEKLPAREKSRMREKLQAARNAFKTTNLKEKLKLFVEAENYWQAFQTMSSLLSTSSNINEQFELLWLAWMSGQKRRAEEITRNILLNSKNDFRIFNSLAIVFLRLNRQQEALSYFEKSLQINPQQPAVIEKLNILKMQFTAEF